MESKSQPPQRKLDTSVTVAELGNFHLATMKLWSLDVNRFKAGKDYKINLQHSKDWRNEDDVAPDPLFVGVDKNKFMSVPTYKAFYDLLDNYEHETGKAEVVTPEEIAENWRFINAICATPCMQYCYHYLVAKNRIHAGQDDFKKMINDLWFNMYRRDKNSKGNDSCGFEHVFVGELSREGKVIGFHNWIQIFLEEKKGKLDYQGFICHKKKGHSAIVPSEKEQLITIQFTWDVNPAAHDKKKDVSSTFIGTSPEFEIALYTLCFLIDDEEDHFCEVGHPDHIYRVNIKCHRWNMKEGVRIGASYPIAIDDN